MTRTIGLLTMTIVLSTAAQILLKFGVMRLGPANDRISSGMLASLVVGMITTPAILIGLFLFGVSAVLWIMVLSKAELSYAFPLLSLGYVLILLPSWYFFGENITVSRIIGTLLISGGVFFITK
jgi:drug/metabolite transporter (DMT)-like permease